MKKILIVLLTCLMLVSTLSACASAATSTPAVSAPSTTAPKTPSAQTTQPAISKASATPSQTAPAGSVASNSDLVTYALKGPIPAPGDPKKGGVLRVLYNTFPGNLGYPNEFSPTDSGFSAFAIEKLIEWDEKGNNYPVLAESWEGDPSAMTVTWHLRKGLRFSDGTPCNAKALKWNLDQSIAAGKLTNSKNVKSVEVIDENSVKMILTDYDQMVFINYGWVGLISPTAFEKAGGGDIEKSKTWARLNPVGTGPFKLVSFKRDDSIKWERNPAYWRKDMPYYDGIEGRFIPDSTTANLIMQNREADVWMGATVKLARDAEAKGLKVNWGPGMGMVILPSNLNPNSPFANKDVRAALEYAIDRPTLAKTIGSGKFEPMTQLAGKDFPAYNPGFDPRPYNPAKARELLAQAGYPNGVKAKLLIMNDPNSQDVGTAIKQLLDASGFQIELDVADMGRFFGSVFGKGWDDLTLTAYGINPDATDLFVHYGPAPMTFRIGIFKSQAFLDLCNKALHTYDQAALMEVEKAIVRQASDDVMVIPLYVTSGPVVMQSYVHSNYAFIHGLQWDFYQDWMSQH
jgi:peptide/nickel transport system substrate-binding protein